MSESPAMPSSPTTPSLSGPTPSAPRPSVPGPREPADAGAPAAPVVLGALPDQRAVFRRVLRLVPVRLRLAVAGTAVLNLAGAALAVASTAVTGRVVDAAADRDMDLLLRRLALLALLTVLAAALVWLSRTTLVRVGERILATLRDRATAAVGAAPLRFLERHRAGELHRRLTGEIAGLAAFAGGTLPDLVSAAAVLAFTVVLLLLSSWHLALALLVLFVPLALLVVRAFHRRSGPAYAGLAEAEADVAATFGESLPAREQLWISGSVPRWLERFGRDTDRLLDARVVQVRADLVLNRLALVQAGALAVLLVLSAALMGRGLLTTGTAVVFVLATRDMLARSEDLAGSVGDAREAHVRLARLLDLLTATTPAAPPTPSARSGWSGWSDGSARSARSAPKAPAASVVLPARGELRAEGVVFAHDPGGRAVLDGLTLTVRPGDRLAVVGETGSGKSTLGKLLAGLYPPDRGRVTFAGHDLADLDTDQLRRRIVLVPQEVALVEGTLAENLAMTAASPDRERITAGLGRLGLTAWADGLPDGLDTPLTDRGLSAGERQLVAIVRAFLTDPAVLVLDEATAGVDHDTAARIEDALAAAGADRTLIVIAHRGDTIARATRRLTLPQGTEDG
ncbi:MULTISPECIES: ABC transporter ATP-binding protein [unclassified Streptomyces]|uniref:ABC transporter ATP-binding protein n=1 Tax=unclassified Streptomyces TaxID=2593676 RepID=UPI0038230873